MPNALFGRFPMPCLANAQCPVWPMPNARFPMPDSQCPMPYDQFPIIMKLQKHTFILIVVALTMAGLVSLYETQVSPKQEAAKDEKHKIFTFKSDRVQFFTVKTPEKILTFERVYAKKGGKSSWEMKLPVQAHASQASVDFLLDRLATGKSDRTIDITASQLPEFGLDQPQATVTVKLDNQETHRLVLGKTDFSGRFLYAQANPAEAPPQNKAQTLPVLLVPFDFKNAVQRPLSEWKKAEIPKPETPQTPSPTPSPENQ